MGEMLNRAASLPKPVAVAGCDAIFRYWDPGPKCWAAKILPGEYYVTPSAEGISTVLGSCISACIRDPTAQVGGMNHFMLPENGANGSGSWSPGDGGASTRYGSFAMERLINELLKLGARRERFEVKLFGGGRILPAMTDVGQRNIDFARSFLALEGITIAAQDVGDIYPRRVMYFPRTGKVLVKHLRAIDRNSIVDGESRYRETLVAANPGNDVELFN